MIGPYTFNFNEATEHAIEAGAAECVQNPQELSERLNALMSDSDLRKRMGTASLAFSKSAGGATQQLMNLIAKHLPIKV